MDLNEFVDVVSKMRNAQVSYFRTRSSEFLKRSKDLERAVDSMIERFYSPQGDLFEGVASCG